MKHEEFYENGNIKSMTDYNEENYKSGYCILFNEHGKKETFIKFLDLTTEITKYYNNNNILEFQHYTTNDNKYGIEIFLLN